MQNLLLIRDNTVVVQYDGISYTDSLDNFLNDGGIPLPNNIKSIDYNKSLGTCWINGEAFKEFPNEYAEQVLSSVKSLSDKFEARKKIREEQERLEREEAERIKQEKENAERFESMTEDERRIEEYKKELSDKEQWLQEHDYIGVKIATGRATIEEYSEEIVTMTEYAKRIETLRELIPSEEK